MGSPPRRALRTAAWIAGALSLHLAAAALWPPRLSAQESEREGREERERFERRRRVPDALGPELAKRLKSGRLDDVEVEVRFPYKEELLVRCRVVGNGVGVWRSETQFKLAQGDVRRIFKTVQDVRFGTLPTEVGEEESGEKEQKGHIVVSVGALSKNVVQLAEGETSPALQRIADTVLDACSAHGPAGVRISGFEDAWSKLSDGRLAAETLEIRVQRRTDHPGTDPPEDWFLRVNGRRVIDRDRYNPPDAQRPTSREMLLSPKEFEDIVAALRENDLPNIPLNVYAPQYTDVQVRVLNKLRHLQARPFTGMTAQTHGEKQGAFDRLFETLSALHRRVVAEGRPAREFAPPPQRPPAAGATRFSAS